MVGDGVMSDDGGWFGIVGRSGRVGILERDGFGGESGVLVGVVMRVV